MRAILSAVLFLVLPSAALAQGFETEATHAVIYDAETDTILWSHNAEEPMPPASMSKLMTVFMAFEAISEGRLSMDDELPVSEEAWRRGGSASGSSTMFLDVNSRARVDDLLRGIIVQSGNDACIVIAEALGGTEANFADMMTDRAHELGLMSANFENSTGWPDPGHEISALDLARLADIMIDRFPELYDIYAEREFTYNGIRQFNRNPLLGVFDGTDGLKTGHTEASGYGLVASAERDGERRIVVFNGMGSDRARANEAERLMRAAFSEFALYELFEAGAEVGEAEVFMGRRDAVTLVTQDPIAVGLSRAARREMQVAIVYEGPLAAPVAEGDVVAHLVVEAPGYESRRYPLVAAEGVSRKGMFGRAADALVNLIRG